VGIVTLHRPKALNALSSPLMAEVNEVTAAWDADPSIGCIVLTGSEKAFAAGADIKEMKDKTYPATYDENMFASWQDVAALRTPTIAAVNGYALGGGCELAMMCDIMLAGSKARFGQPEILLGTIPGAGGTQRLVRAVGKSKAMAMCLTGDQIDAAEALSAGLVAAVHAPEDLVEEAVKMAAKIASLGRPSVMMCKEAVNAAYELSLNEGNRLERRLFLSTFATADQKEGMAAFAEKRKADFKHC
jgi:enoyl-CoA hydratase/carnithine racemase